MYGFSGGALLKDVEKARQEMDQVNAQLGATRRQAMARAARQREKAELRSALAGKKRLLSAAAKGSVLRLNRGHGEDSARAADEALITATFRKFDVDGSGSIDVAELGDALQMVLGKRPNRETVKQLFAIADTDGNGTLDFEEFSQLARKGELVNRKLLNPKYRFLMQARHERAAERDAQAAALAAKKAQIEEAGRRIDETRAEWELVCARGAGRTPRSTGGPWRPRPPGSRSGTGRACTARPWPRSGARRTCGPIAKTRRLARTPSARSARWLYRARSTTSAARPCTSWARTTTGSA